MKNLFFFFIFSHTICSHAMDSGARKILDDARLYAEAVGKGMPENLDAKFWVTCVPEEGDAFILGLMRECITDAYKVSQGLEVERVLKGGEFRKFFSMLFDSDHLPLFKKSFPRLECLLKEMNIAISEKHFKEKNSGFFSLSGESLLRIPRDWFTKLFFTVPLLRVLDLSSNQLCEVPADIGELKCLHRLFLCHNSQLKTLPESMVRLKKLTHLLLNECDLGTLPEFLLELPRLHLVSCMNNPRIKISSKFRADFFGTLWSDSLSSIG